ncbi:thiamine pyrophosphate-binding protein [Paenibacillus sp. NPDC058071]|uniref:thiamine pyrophosphate-binding protein n=1 Tax=Paenibacillus sp. NPDC058071 TaxID=3346326 RepID=UPI0036DDA7B2
MKKRQGVRKKPDEMTGADALLQGLLDEGVDCVFGYPGGSALYIYDAMTYNPDFKHILTRHEQGAVHAADGYARSTGKVGVCIATSGPGATNLVTGIATAYMDSVPLVVITANVSTHLQGSDAFQEADIVSITMPITKHSYFVRKAEDIPRIVREAFYIANTGRKGPVLIDIPKDVSNQRLSLDSEMTGGSGKAHLTGSSDTVRLSLGGDEAALKRGGDIEAISSGDNLASRVQTGSGRPLSVRGYQASPELDFGTIDRLLEALAAAERPIIIAGGGVVYADASDELIQFAQRHGIPVTTTLMGLSGFPSGHDLWLGMPGHHGLYAANKSIQNADFLLVIGSRLDDRITMKIDGFAPQARMIAHIDIDPAEIGKNVRADIACVGDVREVLAYANGRGWGESESAKPVGLSRPRQEWLDRVRRLREEHPQTYRDADDELKPQYVLEMISRTTQGEAIVTTDVGQHQMWTAQFYRFKHPRSLITSGGLGTMGFGFPSAIGAQAGNPGRLVISVNGDGGMQMCAQELAICAIHQIPVKIVVINNQVLGMVRQQQEIIYSSRYSEIDLAGSPDFVKLAEAYGVKGMRANNKQDAERIWQEALAAPGPVLVEFTVPRGENVYPMIPHGSTLDQMITGDEE